MQGSVVRSWLCELAARAFEQEGNDLADARGYVNDSGEGRWTVEDAIDHDVPDAGDHAVAVRALHEPRQDGDYTAKVLAALRNQFGGHARREGAAVSEPRPRQANPLVEGLERLPVHPTTLVIFGGTGDLAKRKLLPAIYNLAHEGALPERFNLIGVSRSDMPRRRVPRHGARVDQAVLPPRARRAGARRGCSRACATCRARSTTTTATRA